MRPIRNFRDEVEALSNALRDELCFDDEDGYVADLAVLLIGSQWFADLTGVTPCDRPMGGAA